MNRHGSSFGSNICSKRVVNSVFSDFYKRWILAQKGVAPIFAHPWFCPQKKPVFCLRSKVLGMLPTCFFVFFYIDFVFFFMIFAYFPIFCQIFCLSKRKLADFGSNLLCFWWSSHANFAEFSDLYGWNYPACPPVWLKLPSTPFCMVEITQHALFYSNWASFERIF